MNFYHHKSVIVQSDRLDPLCVHDMLQMSFIACVWANSIPNVFSDVKLVYCIMYQLAPKYENMK